MNYGYIRVSSDKSTVENQRYEIEKFSENQGIKIDGWIEEIVSGTKTPDKRKLGKLLENVKEDDLILVTELSRLGRSLYMVMDILSVCMENGIKIWTVRDGFRFGDDIQSKVLAFAFGLVAEIERSLISQRTKEALARKKADGVKLGRPVGAKNKHPKLQGKENVIQTMLNGNMNYAQISRVLRIDRTTLTRFCKSYNIKKEEVVCFM